MTQAAYIAAMTARVAAAATKETTSESNFKKLDKIIDVLTTSSELCATLVASDVQALP
ncbi:hypothetical protein [Bosea sp. BK604]|uniref:hypothetical protein n=1 Tax=Bosea sp. BK604 TaxID=2512180 RepID=UPI0010EF8EDE|nr:hypothetical protein [Bosea sp. BK604]TCR62948.1 hypothetical protein EV560_10941 [Bosea sp. BK604]